MIICFSYQLNSPEYGYPANQNIHIKSYHVKEDWNGKDWKNCNLYEDVAYPRMVKHSWDKSLMIM